MASFDGKNQILSKLYHAFLTLAHAVCKILRFEIFDLEKAKSTKAVLCIFELDLTISKTLTV